MKMKTLFEPRAVQFQSIRDNLDDTRFADTAINMALDAFDIWTQTKPQLHDSASFGQTYREWLRAVVPDQFMRCVNVKLGISIFKQLQDEHGSAAISTRRGPSMRQ